MFRPTVVGPLLLVLGILSASTLCAESTTEWLALSEQTRDRMQQMDEIIRDSDEQQSYERYMAIFSPDVIAHGLYVDEAADLEGVRKHYYPVFFELQGGVLLSDDVVVAGRMAAQRYHSMLFLQGEFEGVQADNKPVFMRGQTIFRFDDKQRIEERWSNHDHGFRLQQLKGEQGLQEGNQLSAVLNGPGLSEQAVRDRLTSMNSAFNLVQAPADRESRYLGFFSADVKVHGISASVDGIEELRRYYQEIWSAFSDLERTVDAELSAWSFGAIRWRALGSHRSPYRALAPSDRPVRLRGEAIMRFDLSGQVTEVWINDMRIETL